ncbi:MAG: adenylate/guanylate cyclase domain-containing protein [Rhodospirillales bacterium]|nr:adenylate/guanylate cyclase domain-containing protein [Rhodospirillales bacterium]
MRLRTLRAREILSITAIVAVACAAGLWLPPLLPMLKAGENWLADFRFATLTRPEPQNGDVVVVAITEDTLATLPYREPLDRGFLRGLFGHLEAAKPRAIGFDVLFDQPTEPAKDEALRQALRVSQVPVVVARAGKEEGLTDKQLAFLSRFTAGVPTARVNLVRDRADGTVRWIFPGDEVAGKQVPGFAGALAVAAGARPPEREVPLVYRVGPDPATPPFRVFPAHAVPLLPKAWFAGKVVLVGADLPLSDRHRTPFAAAQGPNAGSRPGVVIHAHAVAQLLDGRMSPAVGGAGRAALILLAAALGMLFATLDLSTPARGACFVAALALLWAGGFALYGYGGPMIPLIAPTVGFVASSGLGVAYIGRRARQQRRFIRNAFKRYLSPALVDQLVADPSRLNLGGERRELTYLFTDLAGFTSLTERTPPAVLMTALNEYLDEMCRILFKHGATMDKIVGDAVVGFFNAPLDQPDHRARAVATALEMDAFSRVFIERQKAKGLEIGVTRIGVHSGVATIGNFGGDAFFNYTAHGDMVNTAARLESVNKHLGTRVCISGVTAAACPGVAFRAVGTLVLKGKKEGIEVFEPLADGLKDAPSTAAYRRAFEMLKRNDSAAIDAFRELLHNAPDDGLARFHLARLQKGESGVVIVMEEK